MNNEIIQPAPQRSRGLASTSRERLQTTLDHRQPDGVCVDFGATFVTGIHVSVVHRLRQRLLGDPQHRVKVIEPYQMLGEIDDELRSALGIDVIGVLPRRSIFGTEQKDWKPFTLPDGTLCLVPGTFNVAPAPDGGWLMYPEGDTTVPPSGHMPAGGYFFDSIIRQPALDDNNLDPKDNLEEFGLLSPEDLAYFREKKQWFEERAEFGSILIIPGSAFGDIALVPAPFLKHPRGIRDITEWYISTKSRPEYIRAIFEKQCDFAMQNLETLIGLFGDTVQVALLTGTDFGTQRGPFISVASYRNLFKPFHKKLNDLIHRRSNWKTFIHSCGSVYQLLPEFIDAGFDVLNPVQCSAVDMDPVRLKTEFGKDLVFWGGGVNTQQTMAFGTPQQVEAEVRQRIRIFNEGGGYVFDAIHNIQGDTPIENVEAMFKATQDSRRG